MLDYARLDHPGLRMDCRQVELGPWLAHVLATCPSHGRSVTMAPHGGPETAWKEPRLMELALSNPLANALRHARGQVALEWPEP